MILLDTNVVSEMMRLEPDARVARWLAGIEPDEVFTSAVTAAELLVGISLLPEGKRRRGLAEGTHRMLHTVFAQRMLPFDLAAAEHFAVLSAHRQRSGTRIEILDGQIAAVARANGMVLATRNVKHFQDCGIELLDPWQA